MSGQQQPSDGGGGMQGGFTDPNSWSSAVNRSIVTEGGVDSYNTMKGDGDVAMLKKLLEDMSGSNSAAGMESVFKQIFSRGFESQMPKLLNAANTSGIRPQDSTTQQLLQNDMIARLTGESNVALQKQQATFGDLASKFASLTEKPVVTKISGDQKASGETNKFSLFANGIGW